MHNTIKTFLVAAAAASAAGDFAAAAPLVRIETVMYVLGPAERHVSIIADSAETGLSTSGDGQHWVFFRAPRLHLGNDDFKVDRGRIVRSDGSIPPKLTPAAAPAIVTRIDEPAEVAVSSPVEYFEKMPDGSFRLHRGQADSGEAAHFNLFFTPHAAPGKPEGYSVDCKLDCSVIADRERIPGVDLDVGKPKLANFREGLTADMSSGAWYCLLDASREEGDYRLVIFLMVSPETEGSNR